MAAVALDDPPLLGRQVPGEPPGFKIHQQPLAEARNRADYDVLGHARTPYPKAEPYKSRIVRTDYQL